MIPGSVHLEQHLHWRFFDDRIRGEWFDPRRNHSHLNDFINEAFRRLLQYVLMDSPFIASEMAEHLYVPEMALMDVQRCASRMTDEAPLDTSPMRR